MAMIDEDGDLIEKGEVVTFLHSGCVRSKGLKSALCLRQFSEYSVLWNLNTCVKLSNGELDLVILANIQAFTSIEVVGENRKRCLRSSFSFQSRTICKDMFLNLYGISYSQFRKLETHGIYVGVMESWSHGKSLCFS